MREREFAHEEGSILQRKGEYEKTREEDWVKLEMEERGLDAAKQVTSQSLCAFVCA